MITFGATRLRARVWTLLLGVLILGARTASGAPSAQGGVVLSPADDAFVRIRSPVANFDEHPQGISVTAVGFPEGLPEDFGYLRFNVSAYGGTVADAQLELYNRIAPGPAVTVGLYAVEGDDWNGAAEGLGDETTITFSNAPAEAALLDVQPGAAAPAWMVFQSAALTAHLAARVAGGSEWVTLRLRVMSNGMTNLNFFEDREDGGGTGNTPRLHLSGVTLLPPSPTPTATATPTVDPLATASPSASPTATRTATSTPTPTRPTATATVSATAPPNPSASATPTESTPTAIAGATGTITVTASPTSPTEVTPDGTGTPTPDAQTPTASPPATAPITSTLATPDATTSPPPTDQPSPTASPEATVPATPDGPTGTPDATETLDPRSTPPTATLESTPTGGPTDATPSPVATTPGPLRRAYLPMLLRSTAGGR